MTEKEKMLAHQMYDANYNKELHDERIAAKELCWESNSGAIMATTSNWAKISTPTTTWSSLIVLR